MNITRCKKMNTSKSEKTYWSCRTQLCLLLCFLYLFPCPIHAQQNFEWGKTYGGSLHEAANAMVTTPDGGYVIVGVTMSSDGDFVGIHDGFEDFCVMKVDSTGSLVWEKSLGGGSPDVADGIAQTLDGGFVVVGVTTSTDGDVTGLHGLQDMWVVKLSEFGNIEWEECFGGNANDYAMAVTATNDSGCAIAGWTLSNRKSADAWILKLDQYGNLEWDKIFERSGNDVINSIVQTSDNGFALAGWTSQSVGEIIEGYSHDTADFWVLKISNKGDLEWQKTFGGSGDDKAACIIQTYDGGYAIAGYSDSKDGDVFSWKDDTLNYKDRNFWIIKLDTGGVLEWEKVLGGSKKDQANSMIQSIDGGFVIAGQTSSYDGDIKGFHPSQNLYYDNDAWIAKLDNYGNFLWQKAIGGSSDDKANVIIQDLNQGYTFAGSTSSYDGDVTLHTIITGHTDIWIGNIQNNDTVNSMLIVHAIDSNFHDHNFGAIERTYKFTGIGDSIVIDDISLNWKSKTRFTKNNPDTRTFIIRKGGDLRVVVKYDPFTQGSDSVYLHVLSNQVNYEKSFLLRWGSFDLPEASTHFEVEEALSKNKKITSSAGDLIKIDVNSSSFIPANVQLKTLRLNLQYNSNVINLSSLQPSNSWSLSKRSGIEGNLDLLLTKKGDEEILPGDNILAMVCIGILNDSTRTTVRVSNAIFNDFDSNYAKRILALPSSNDFEIDLKSQCGDSILLGSIDKVGQFLINSITPNPTVSNVVISLHIPIGHQKSGYVEVYDALGNIEQKQALQFDEYHPTEKISLNLRGSGVHYIRVITALGVSTKMVVVEK